jgi:pyruvate/2-oxoglutarate dehydrogenase complex dihydrolipoamide acyltransferase (E2) component
VVVGQPALQGASVVAEVVRHGKDDKIVVYKMKRRKGYRRKQGHRQDFTEILVREIELGSGKSAKPKAKAAKPKPEKPAAKAKPAPKAEPAKAPKAEAKPKEAPAADGTIEITDAARELAEEHGIDLSTIEGSGKEGRILKSDIDKAIKEIEGT